MDITFKVWLHLQYDEDFPLVLIDGIDQWLYPLLVLWQLVSRGRYVVMVGVTAPPTYKLREAKHLLR